jgi:UDP-N-acetyl-D-mannosaminuronic acid dehydrogenase
MFALAGHAVLGVDPSERVRAALRPGGQLHINEPDLQTLVAAALNSGRLRVCAEPEPADVFVLAVPTPFSEATRRADLSFVRTATESIVPYLQPGNLVILESTVPPGTTRDTLAPILAQSGLQPGRDVALAHCPERVLPGRILLEMVENDRLAGGLTPRCAERAAELYATFVKGNIFRTDATTAELVKLMENTFRDVNVALANEFALVAEHVGVNVWDAIGLANRHPRVNVLRPGPGVGGHCIAVDPWFLVESAPEQTPLIRQAREVNDAMPEHLLQRLHALASPGGRVALLGLTYKANVDDLRESPAVRFAELVVAAGYDVRICDPHVASDRPEVPAPLFSLEEAVVDAEVVVLLVDHSVFKDIDPTELASHVARRRVLDARGFLNRAAWEASGFEVDVLGTPSVKGRRLPPTQID